MKRGSAGTQTSIWDMPLGYEWASGICHCSCPHSSRNAMEISLEIMEISRVACRDGAGVLLNVSCWLWVRAQSKSCMLEVPVLPRNIPQISPPSAPAFLTEGPQVRCSRHTQAKGESLQCFFVAPVFHQVCVDLLEMQECQKSYIWSWNFYFSLKDTIRTFQAVY